MLTFKIFFRLLVGRPLEEVVDMWTEYVLKYIFMPSNVTSIFVAPSLLFLKMFNSLRTLFPPCTYILDVHIE